MTHPYKNRVAKLLIALCLMAAYTIKAADLKHLTAEQASHLMQQKKITSEELTRYYLHQIQQHNSLGPALFAITDINRDALKLARRLDVERKTGKIRGPLHGLPVVLKANIATADGMPTTAGALALKGFLTKKDAALVAQLRAAGAVILAKANLSEWANFRGPGSASGWSILGGQTKNPYSLEHSPCGSSSGSAVAVAADLTLLAVGTETDGSITCPAAVNGIVGIKPTHGAVSGQGIIPIASSQDTAGPMARTVADAALLLDAMALPQAQSHWTTQLSLATAANTVKKVVLVRAFDQDFPAIKQMMDDMERILRQQSIPYEVIREWQLPEQLYQDEFTVLLYEFKRDLEKWLQEYQAPKSVNSLQKIINFNLKQGKKALAFYGQDYLLQANDLDLSAQQSNYETALQRARKTAVSHLDQYLPQNGSQVLVMPATSAAWPIDHVRGDAYSFGTSTAAAVSGYPSLTLPAGSDGVLPLGVSIVGLPWSEPMLVGFAALLEQQLPARKAPVFK